MPVSFDLDADLVSSRLADWLGRRIPGAREMTVSPPEIPEYSGFSHVTMLADASWTRDGLRQQLGLVVKLLSGEHEVFIDPDPALDYRVMEALGPTEVRAPATIGLEPDPGMLGAPFYVIERVAGDIPPDRPPYTFEGWLIAASPDEQARVWNGWLEQLAAVRRADVAVEGLPDDLIGDLVAYHPWVMDGRPNALLDDAVTFLRDAEPVGEPCFCWGDARIGNMIFARARAAAVLDWEMAQIADPVSDLAWGMTIDRLFSEGLGMPRLPGFASAAETVETYERLTGATVKHLPYYLAYAATRFALILIRLGTIFERTGQEPPLGPDYARDNFALTFLSTVLEEARA